MIITIGGLKICHFSNLPIFNDVLPNFQGLVSLKMWQIDAKDMDVAQPVWLSGCPIKGHFRAKNAFLMFSSAIQYTYQSGQKSPFKINQTRPFKVFSLKFNQITLCFMLNRSRWNRCPEFVRSFSIFFFEIFHVHLIFNGF